MAPDFVISAHNLFFLRLVSDSTIYVHLRFWLILVGLDVLDPGVRCFRVLARQRSSCLVNVHYEACFCCFSAFSLERSPDLLWQFLSFPHLSYLVACGSRLW